MSAPLTAAELIELSRAASSDLARFARRVAEYRERAPRWHDEPDADDAVIDRLQTFIWASRDFAKVSNAS